MELLLDDSLSGINISYRYKQHAHCGVLVFYTLSQKTRQVSHPRSILKQGLFMRRRARSQSKVPQSLLLCGVGVFHSSS